MEDSGLREDRHAACQIQSGLASDANTHFTFGHYEQAIGHFHRCLTEHVEMLKAGALGKRRDRESPASGNGIDVRL